MGTILDWLPKALRDQGLRVAEDAGWEDRAYPGRFGPIHGVICHHTACAAPGNMPSLGLLRAGRSDLPGPLAHLGLGRDGTFYVIAGGHCNHAGKGSWQGFTDTGNDYFIGIEAENNGVDEVWPPAQVEAYQHGVAAILMHIGENASMCCGHKEYAPKRKIDPAPIEMTEFRAAVKNIMESGTKVQLIPNADDKSRRTLARGMSGDDVKEVQTDLHVTVDGLFGASTEAAVRSFQAMKDARADGIVGPKTWALLDAAAI